MQFMPHRNELRLHHVPHGSFDVLVLLGVHLSEVERDVEEEEAAEDVAVDVFYIFC